MKKCTRCKKEKNDECFITFDKNRTNYNCTTCDYCRQIKNISQNKSDKNHPELYLLSKAKSRAKEKQIECTINSNDILEIIKSTPICPIRKTPFEKGTNGAVPNSMTLDRIDSTKGYIKGNIQILSFKANVIKGSITIDEMESFLNSWKEYENSKKTEMVMETQNG